jgi:phosphoglucomutase
VFSGNEIGVILGHWQIIRWKKTHINEPAAVLASVVSSRMLSAIAIAEFIIYRDTLTG